MNNPFSSNGGHAIPKVRISRSTRVALLAAFAGGITTTGVMQLARLAERNVASDGKHVTDHAYAAAGMAGLTASTLVRLFIPSEKPES